MGYYFCSFLGLVSNTLKDRYPLNFVFRAVLLSVRNKVMALNNNVVHIKFRKLWIMKHTIIYFKHTEKVFKQLQKS